MARAGIFSSGGIRIYHVAKPVKAGAAKEYHLIRGILFVSIVTLAALGVPIARKFLRGLIVGSELYVVLEIDGKTLVYKNPYRYLTSPEDKPLDVVPDEIFESDKFETYYNVCWFDGQGSLRRCEHSYHRTEENATYCKYASLEHTIIGKVLEQR